MSRLCDGRCPLSGTRGPGFARTRPSSRDAAVDQQQRRKQQEGGRGQYQPARHRRALAPGVLHASVPSIHPRNVAAASHPGKGRGRPNRLLAVRAGSRTSTDTVEAPGWPTGCLPLRTGAGLLIFVPGGAEQVPGSGCRWRQYHRISPGPWLSRVPLMPCSVPFPGAVIVRTHMFPPLLPSVVEMLLAPEDPRQRNQ